MHVSTYILLHAHGHTSEEAHAGGHACAWKPEAGVGNHP